VVVTPGPSGCSDSFEYGLQPTPRALISMLVEITALAALLAFPS
jgi:hypothetical protein